MSKLFYDILQRDSDGSYCFVIEGDDFRRGHYPDLETARLAAEEFIKEHADDELREILWRDGE
jgi:hypothetical protein